MTPPAEGEIPPDGALVHRLLREWRMRCASRRAAWELTVGLAAEALCGGIVRTLEQGEAAPALAGQVRAWGVRVSSAPDARAVLQCLGEATAVVVGEAFGDLRPRGMDAVLLELARESALPAAGRGLGVADAHLDGEWLHRRALERDLAVAVGRAGDADVTVAVLELEDDASGATQDRAASADAALTALARSVQASFGRGAHLYRLGARAVGVLLPEVAGADVGERILLTTCSGAPRFAWGRASLRDAGPEAHETPDVLLVLAEADMHFRRRDLAHAQSGVSRRRITTVVGSAAAAMLLVAGVGAALEQPPGAGPVTQVALPEARTPVPPAGSGGAPAPAPAPPSDTVPPVSPPAPAPAPAPKAPAAPTASNAVLTSFQTTSTPTATPTAAPPAAPPVPAPPPPPPPAPAPAPAPAPSHGHSGSAPGHTKGSRLA